MYPPNSQLASQHEQLLRQAELLDQLRREVHRLGRELAESRAARTQDLPPKVLRQLVRGAYENGSLSGGAAAELLHESVLAFLGRRWPEDRRQSQLDQLTQQVEHCRVTLVEIANFLPRSDEAAMARRALQGL